MRTTFTPWRLPAALVGGLLSIGPIASAQTDLETETTPETTPVASDSVVAETPAKAEAPVIDLFTGLRSGELGVQAEGADGGAMTLAVTNRGRRPLRVVLPPGLIASGAAGQFGGGGFGGGGMGGGGMGGGGMGGMGGGGMGGGMGGGGMGGGGMGGGGMGGGGMGGGGGAVMPASMGMMMLGMLIMQLVGEIDSWDPSSLMMGGGMMGGGMGGMGGGMGGMGGGMGGMGGGMGGMGGGMGGMGGGGFRSIPPTDLPHANLAPGQTRSLRTAAISLSPPVAGRAVLPTQGEPLQIGDISQLERGADPAVQKALRQLAIDKAPATIAQLVMWRLLYDADWEVITELSRHWANGHELALARQFVARIARPDTELSPMPPATLHVKFEGEDPLAEAMQAALDGSYTLGMTVELDAPSTPTGPSITCIVQFNEAATGAEDREATVRVYASDAALRSWVPMGKFALPIAEEAEAEAICDAMAEGVLGRLVRAQLTKGRKVRGQPTYKLRVDNASPLLLNALAVTGPAASEETPTAMLPGFALSPRRSATFTISASAVERLGLESEVRVTAADLSGL